MERLTPAEAANKRTEVIEINIGSSIANAYNFGQLPNLKNAKRIISIEAYDVAQVTLSRLNKSVITNAILKKSYLQLVAADGSNAVIATLPLVDISKQTQASVIERQNFPTIDWEKSTVNVAETTGLNCKRKLYFQSGLHQIKPLPDGKTSNAGKGSFGSLGNTGGNINILLSTGRNA